MMGGVGWHGSRCTSGFTRVVRPEVTGKLALAHATLKPRVSGREAQKTPHDRCRAVSRYGDIEGDRLKAFDA